MTSPPRLAVAVAALALLVGPASAAQIGDADIRMGAQVRGSDGALGTIESVVADSSGRARQVVVRGRSVPGLSGPLKSLPITALRAHGRDYTVPLKKSEFALLPSAKGR